VAAVDIGTKLRELREERGWSQEEIEVKTGLLRCYTSRVENGHTIPSLQTLEKLARAFEIPMYMLFFDGDGKPKPLRIRNDGESRPAGKPAQESDMIVELQRRFAKMNTKDRNYLIWLAAKLARSGD
jgi:transcriptional regulator with XRE-family HTH domain